MAIKKLLFVDTNIWLDFYRARTEAGLGLLSHLEKISDRIIVTYQVEMEFKKNRQAAIIDGMSELKSPSKIARPGLFSDAQATRSLQKHLKDADSNIKKMKHKMGKVLADPSHHDPVYQACQRIFHRDDDLILTRGHEKKKVIRNRALRRFLHGSPPRKNSDTSFGDAINWEWLVQCAIGQKAEVMIVSRDSDYGVTYDGVTYVNDHLSQEFSERVSRKRKVILYPRLTPALKHFKIPITDSEQEAEKELTPKEPVLRRQALSDDFFAKLLAELRQSAHPPAPSDDDDS